MTTTETFAPANLDELQCLIAWAADESAPLTIEGGGTKREFGQPIDTARLVSTRAMTGVSLYEPDELVISAACGTRLAEIEALIAEQQQMLAFEPADYGAILGAAPGTQTVGGVFACNLAGPRRIKAGAARDHLLGLNCVTGHGQIIKTGGRVMKNVTGYDLCKLLTGSFGTLAVMSHLTFKVLPAPEFEVTLVVPGHDRAALLAILRQAMGTAWEVSAAAMLPEAAAARSDVAAVAAAGGALALLRLEGSEPSVRYRRERLQTELTGAASFVVEHETSKRLWREIRDVALLPRQSAVLWRLSCPPTRAEAIALTLEPLGFELMFDWAGGLIWLAADEPHAQAVRASLGAGGGHATLVRAPLEARRRTPVFQPQAKALAALNERVKKCFDPNNILNPGRTTHADPV